MTQNNTRRSFLQQSAAATGALVLGGSVLPAIAASPTTTLSAADLNTAIECIVEQGYSPRRAQQICQKEALTLLVLEHVATLAATGSTQEIENVLNTYRNVIAGTQGDRDKNLRAVREVARDVLAA